MPPDAPDGSVRIIRTEVIGSTVALEVAANEHAIAETEGKTTTTSQTMADIAKWTVTTARNGILYGVEMFGSPVDKAEFKLTVEGTELFTNLELPSALNLHFAEMRLEAGDVVELQGRSNDGTSVDLWGMVEGKEVA